MIVTGKPVATPVEARVIILVAVGVIDTRDPCTATVMVSAASAAANGIAPTPVNPAGKATGALAKVPASPSTARDGELVKFGIKDTDFLLKS